MAVDPPPPSRARLSGRPNRPRAVTHALFATRPGRLLVVGATVRFLVYLLHTVAGLNVTLLNAIGALGTIAALVGLAYFVSKAIARAKRRMLWRVRRKLILSYVFVGVVPVLLVVAFFLLAGLLIFFNVSAYLVASSLHAVEADARFLAQTTVADLAKSESRSRREVLERMRSTLSTRYAGASFALVPTSGQACAGASVRPPAEPAVRPGRDQPAAVAVGPWAYLSPPEVLPTWVACGGAPFEGLVAVAFPPAPGESGAPEIGLVVRAAVLPDGADPAFAVVVDIPIDTAIRKRITDVTGVPIESVTLIEPHTAEPLAALLTKSVSAGAAASADPGIPWATVLDWSDWVTGAKGKVMVSLRVNAGDVYGRILGGQATLRDRTLGSTLLSVLWGLAILFFVIEAVALLMGLVLARSITGSVHELFAGTERVRQGDFAHKITIQTRDQMGDLAESFNSMTASIEDLLRQAEEKKRLEEELRIAREIQMSLLPRGALAVPGLSITALCVPAREVGGDYYDLLPLDDRHLGVLIADVAGKGTSAAFYMAELKGLIMSLSRIYQSPRQLLIEANRIIAHNLDTRSFITMTYAVVDVQARTMTYARAGHTPLMYRTAEGLAAAPQVHVLAPDGLVLGIQIDDGGRLFERLLTEETLQLHQGDVLLFYTDGITEAMNDESDCFGEGRLGEIVAEHGDLPPEQLRERILREIEAFVAGAPQHDDMTMILLKVEALGIGAISSPVGAYMATPHV